MNNLKAKLSAVLILIIWINFTKATPSTIIWIPSVDFQSFNTLHLGIDNYIRTKNYNGTRGAGIYDIGLTGGVLPFKLFQLEAGVDYMSMGDNIYDNDPVYFNSKAGFPENALFKNAPAIAIGGYYFGTKRDLTNYNIVYGLVGKTVPFIGRVSAGYYVGNEKLLLDSNGEKDNSGVLLSWDRPMKEISDKLWFAVDYQGGKNFLGALNFGFSWAFTNKISLLVGYNIYNDKRVLYNSTDANRNSFTTQIDINF